ncbi:MAG: VCBS repeat-containing protein [Bacteroidota bacterium]
MQHIPEYTIELYVLRAPEVESERSTVERHLRTCAKCRDMEHVVREFYLNVEHELRTNADLGKVPRRALVRKSNEVMPFWEDQAPITGSLTSVQRFQWFVGSNAVPLSVGLLGVFAVLFLFLTVKPDSDNNPWYVRANKENSQVEVFNREGAKLWSLPNTTGAEVYSNEVGRVVDEFRNSYAEVVDLDSDGSNEVLSILSESGEAGARSDVVRVYDSGGRVLWKKKLGASVQFAQERYPDQFKTAGLVVGDLAGNGRKEIFVGLAHYHSPYAIVRLDAKGNEIGSYWLFGHFFGLKLVDLRGDGKKSLIACGVDNIGLTTPLNESNAIVAALDPTKIVETRKSTLSIPYSFPTSDAEEYIIQLPTSAVERGLNSRPRASIILSENENQIVVGYSNPVGTFEPTDWLFLTYYFSRDMKVLDIKPTDTARRFYTKLIQQGKISVVPDSQYFEKLRKDVRYWNGTEWTREAVKVNPVSRLTDSR